MSTTQLTFNLRVKRRRIELGLSQAEVARRTGGVLSQTTIANIESGRNKGTTELVALAVALQCDPSDLDPRSQYHIREKGQAYLSGVTMLPNNVCYFLPHEKLLSLPATFSTEEIATMATTQYPCPHGHGPRAFCFRAQGISMENPSGGLSIPGGHIVFIDPDRVPSANGGDLDSCVLVRSVARKEVFLRQLIEEQGRQFLKALNPAWPARITEFEDFEIIGTVIGTGKFLSPKGEENGSSTV